nr:phosphate-starvation-inducible PsiE family protein [Geitlerinema sp. PCC 9228]
MVRLKQFWRRLLKELQDEQFLHRIEQLEGQLSKFLTIVMVIFLLVAVVDLVVALTQQLLSRPLGSLTDTLFPIFGLFLNILIALEIMENITAYLRQHYIQLELAIGTSLIAVSRKIVLFDFKKDSGVDLIGLAIAVFTLTLSYWIIRSGINNEDSRK